MKKRSLKSLELNKSSISQLGSIIGSEAQTCQGPCEGGSGCCNWGTLVCPMEPTEPTGIFSGCPVC